jgi:hypothetical protein
MDFNCTSKFQLNEKFDEKKFWIIWDNETFYPLLYSVRDFRSFVASSLWGSCLCSGFLFFWDSKMFQSGFCDIIILKVYKLQLCKFHPPNQIVMVCYVFFSKFCTAVKFSVDLKPVKSEQLIKTNSKFCGIKFLNHDLINKLK